MLDVLKGENVHVTLAKPLRIDLCDGRGNEVDVVHHAVRVLRVTGHVCEVDGETLLLEGVSVVPHVGDCPETSWLVMGQAFAIPRANILGMVSVDDVSEQLERSSTRQGKGGYDGEIDNDLLAPASTHAEDYLEDEHGPFVSLARKAAAIAFGGDTEGRKAGKEGPGYGSSPAATAVVDAFGIDPEEVVLSLARSPGQSPQLLVNWQQSMRVTTGTRHLVESAVRAFLPERCQSWEISVI